MLSKGIKNYCQISTPIGPYVAISNGNKLIGLKPSVSHHKWCENDPVFDILKTDLDMYFSGKLKEFTTPFQLEGTEFSKKVWNFLVQIPYGETWSYEELAVKVGGKNYARAVASANGRNPISIIVPCHRVVNKNGDLGGYNGGLDKKQFLLDLESKSNHT